MLRNDSCLLILVLLSCKVGVRAAEPVATQPDPAGVEFFEAKIRPVLVERCYSCHSGEAQELRGALRLDSRAAIEAGGDSGAALVRGEPNKSLLIEAIRYAPESYQMPPDGKLPDSVIADFEHWVAMGAPDPRVAEASGVPPPSDFDAILTERRKHWAFQPLAQVAPPVDVPPRWAGNPIDQFIFHQAHSKGLEPAPPVEKSLLLRRVYLDLIGLPPTIAEQQRFAADPSPAAFARVVDELLARPEYGERWARHWLDVVRYSDTSGHELDSDRPMHWRYRDYVIDALNRDVPYNRFVSEHLAGEQMPPRAANGADNVSPIGLNYLWFHEMDHLPPEPNLQRADQVDAQIDVTTKAFLALTVSCARCHDHKFDAVSQADYYALAGVFHSTVQAPQRIGAAVKPSDPELAAPAAKLAEEIETLRRQYQQEANARLAAKWSQPVPVTEDNFWGDQRTRLATMRSELAALEPSSALWCQSAVDENVRDIPLHIRGAFNKFGAVIPRGGLTALSPTDERITYTSGSGRAQLAEEIVASPLAKRVIVNRLWQHHFGRGLVASTNNFGVQGELPTHPELLDYLAGRLVAEGWSLKALHRLMLLSETYQLSSQPVAASLAADPLNKHWHYRPPQRLDAEVIRDSLLVLARQLEPAVGGEGVQPYISPNASANKPDFLPKSGPLDGGRRRSIYIKVRSNYLTSMLAVFDFPSPGASVGVRVETSSPLQALSLLNNPFVQEQAAHWARQSADEPDESARATLMFREAFCRSPKARELAVMQELLANRRAAQPDSAGAEWAELAHVLVCSQEMQFAY